MNHSHNIFHIHMCIYIYIYIHVHSYNGRFWNTAVSQARHTFAEHICFSLMRRKPSTGGILFFALQHCQGGAPGPQGPPPPPPSGLGRPQRAPHGRGGEGKDGCKLEWGYES